MATVAISPLDSYRPAVEAIDDLEWLVNEAPVEMGERSALGDILEKAAIQHHWFGPTKAEPDGHYGQSYGAGQWREWVSDPRAPMNAAGECGYFRDIWAERGHQTRSSKCVEPSIEQRFAAEMMRNLEQVLLGMPSRLVTVALVRHAPRVHAQKMREVFGGVVRIVHLSPAARGAFREAQVARAAVTDGVEELRTAPRPLTEEQARLFERLAQPLEGTLYGWLEGVAMRVSRSKPKAGETKLVGEVRSEMASELARAYVAFEDARAKLPRGKRYPHQRAARFLRGIGRGGGGK